MLAEAERRLSETLAFPSATRDGGQAFGNEAENKAGGTFAPPATLFRLMSDF
jgi:hypothetical protein